MVPSKRAAVQRRRRDRRASWDILPITRPSGLAERFFPETKLGGVRKTTEWLISQDENADGILEGAQPNTLDATWYSPVAWLSSLYLTALRTQPRRWPLTPAICDLLKPAEESLGRDESGLLTGLFSDGYFINRPDPQHPEAINSGSVPPSIRSSDRAGHFNWVWREFSRRKRPAPHWRPSGAITS